MESNAAWLEVLLKQKHEQNCTAKVLSTETNLATKKGDNYMSEIKRIKMDVILKSGKIVKKSIISKNLPPTEYHKNILKEMTLFQREIVMYRDITPKMGDILLEFGDYTEPLWTEILDYKDGEQIFFHDLAQDGYVMADRMKGLDLEHCLLVVRSIAKFHATSVILKERGLIPIDTFGKYIFNAESIKEMMNKYYTEALKRFITTIETEWEPEWQPYAVKLKENVLPKLIPKTIEQMEVNPKRFNVLNHGDFWMNNMLFKYGIDSVTPIIVKFIDLQLCFYSSPAYDLQYFLSTSPNLDVRKNSIDKLLKVYHESLVKQLELYSFKGDIPTLDGLHKEMNDFNLFGLMTSLMLLPIIFRKDDDETFPEFEEMIKNQIEGDKIIWCNCFDPMYNIFLKELLTSLDKNKSLE